VVVVGQLSTYFGFCVRADSFGSWSSTLVGGWLGGTLVAGCRRNFGCGLNAYFGCQRSLLGTGDGWVMFGCVEDCVWQQKCCAQTLSKICLNRKDGSLV